MKRDYVFFIKDMIEGMEWIEKFIVDLNYEQFIKDYKTAIAVIGLLEIIGEASKNIPANVRGKYNKIPWSDMARMRDKPIHAYFVIDYEIVWKVAKDS
jgi:uncharacterized protein with HEPN domain